MLLFSQHGPVSQYTERSRSQSVDCFSCCSGHWHDDTSSICCCRPHLAPGKFYALVNIVQSLILHYSLVHCYGEGSVFFLNFAFHVK